MAFISNDEINAIRNQANIVDIIGSYIPLTQKGKDYKCVCPFHDDHSPSMSISVSKQIYKCFACNAAGNVFTFVANYENVSFAEAIKIVADKIGYKLSAPINTSIPLKFPTEQAIMDLANKFYQNNLNTKNGLNAKKYLIDRGLSEDTIKNFGIGLSLDEPDSLANLLLKKDYDPQMLENIGLINLYDNRTYDVFSRRITFPLCDQFGHVIGFSSRIYRGEKDTAKYINTKETYLFKKGDNLFNYHRAKESAKKSKSLIIVEGQMDAIRVSSSGFENVVALMGTALTKEQIELIKKLHVKVLLNLDSDSAGEHADLLNGDLLIKANLPVQVVTLSDAKDPDEYILKFGPEAYKKNLNNAVDYFDFKMLVQKKGINPNNSEEIATYINSLLEDLNNVSDSILKELTLSKISKEYNISLDILKSKLKETTNVSNIAKEVFEPEQPKKRIKDGLSKSIEQVLIFMMNDIKYIKMYQNYLGFFYDPIYREIANEIVYYSEKNKTINEADFISYIANNEHVYQDVLNIVSSYEVELSRDNMLAYISVIDQKTREQEIKKLKEQLKNELDLNKKIKITEQIASLKKGSVLDGNN